MAHLGEPLQLLFVEENGRYRVDEDVLRRVCGHEAARSLPVAVVSVAGATRGGKSFLLDFFLRYLRASDEDRRSGAWIGTDDEPLTGFSWASGWEPNTIGILLWSEPIIVTQQIDGVRRQIAVLLMDTQGTFDSNTELSVSNTIFAMATLTSSILVYNILQMINEDHLRHLQLFTELGRMAREDDDNNTFQSLIFRVRDWEWPNRLPYGVNGGDRYLQEVHRSSALLRDQIWRSFERVSCVLTPYPGRAITESDFNGLRNVDLEFKTALLEVVPYILDPSRLMPKTINDNEVTLESLPIFFRTYTAVFNSEDIPPAHSIYEGMSALSLETAQTAARAAYCAHMDAACGGEKNVARSAVATTHRAALTVALNTFTARRKLGTPSAIAARLQALESELDSRLPTYVSRNNDKIATAVARSKDAYRRHMEGLAGNCLLPAELQQEQEAAVAAARAVYDDARAAAAGDGADADRATLLQDLEAMLPLYRENNTNAIARLCAAAREHNEASLSSASRSARCLHPDTLAAAARDASAGALLLFDRAWRENSAYNEHRNTLIQHMEGRSRHYESTNETNNNQIVEEAYRQYQNHMDLVCGSDRLCLHPLDLVSENGRGRTAATECLLGARSAQCRTLPDDVFITKLKNKISRRYSELEERNEDLNKKAVKRALTVYEDKLEPNRHDNVFSRMFSGKNWGIHWRHEDSKKAALEFFQLLRREGPQHDSDAHLDTLLKEIREANNWAHKRLNRNII